MAQAFIFDHVNGKVKQVYPCRCGVTHTGPYAGHDYAHHNCFHDAPLERIEETEDLICPQCGKTFALK